jgi:hypothetical protein
MSLIRTIEQFCAHVRVSTTGTDLANLAPDLRLVERQQLRPVLGPALHNELSALSDEDLQAALDDSTSATGALLRLVHEALANLGLLEYLPLNQLQINDGGVYVMSGGKSPFQWQINELKASLRNKGFNALEAVLTYLDEHVDDFPAWATSAAAVDARVLLISSATEFSRHYDINGSRLTYQAFLPLIRKVERFQLEALLSAEYLRELKAQLVASTLAPDNRDVLDEYLRPALAHLVVAKAVGEVGLSFNGANIELNIFRPDNANEREADAGLDGLLKQKASQAAADAQVYLTKLRRHLNSQASLTRFATYFTSSAYVDPQAPRPTVRNSVDSPTYGFFG